MSIDKHLQGEEDGSMGNEEGILHFRRIRIGKQREMGIRLEWATACRECSGSDGL